jgi:hypothetical protein
LSIGLEVVKHLLNIRALFALKVVKCEGDIGVILVHEYKTFGSLDLQPNGKIRISNTNSIEHIFYKSFLYD